jgi:hypothetical protein
VAWLIMRFGKAVLIKIRTALALGWLNLVRIFLYRCCVRFGIGAACRNTFRQPLGDGKFFREAPSCCNNRPEPKSQWWGHYLLFGWFEIAGIAPPAWHKNLISGESCSACHLPWWKIPDFSETGDIKVIWELSRFDWVLTFSERVRNGDREALARLNGWLADWVKLNPPYLGPNWKCGQEASIRIMHLAMATLLLEQVDSPEPGLRDLVAVHAVRVVTTINYAMAQDNNHGTSEAAALFIGGSWLQHLGVGEGASWHRLGRKWLENRVARLIEDDGSFSQYSLNYHRLMLDTLSMVEVWRRHLGLPEFSAQYQTRLATASRWLAAMVDHRTGDAPNLGANDGARLLPLTDTDYRDFRPSVQLAMTLFTGERAFTDDGAWNAQLAWLGVDLPDKVVTPSGSRVFDDGGYALLRRGDAMALLRYPRFSFRPGQADALHLDLWLDGDNLLRDAGTYSYNADPEWLAYFPGTVSHNTVQFDDRDQMPRLSRFLFGDWLKTESLQPLVENAEETTFGAGYRDGEGARHRRSLRLTDNRIIVRDEVDGFTGKAVLRWRVRPGDWRLAGRCLTDGKHVLSIETSTPGARIELVSGWESRYYMQKTPVPVLEVEIHKPGVMTTEYNWAP